MAASVPTWSRPGSTKTAKLRASCDSCNEAKVRCSKDKPQCTRCLSHGTSCIYSPSQRAGKYRTTGKGGIQRPSIMGAVDSNHQRIPSTTTVKPPKLHDWGFGTFGLGLHMPKDIDFGQFNSTGPSPLSPQSNTNFSNFHGGINVSSQTSPLDDLQHPTAFPTFHSGDISSTEIPNPNIFWGGQDAALSPNRHFYPSPPADVSPNLMFSSFDQSFVFPPQNNCSQSPSEVCSCTESLSKQLLKLCTSDEGQSTTFDVQLAQSKESTALCAKAIKCNNCNIHNGVAITLIASLIARTINLLERALQSSQSIDTAALESDLEFNHVQSSPPSSLFSPRSSISTSPSTSSASILNTSNTPPWQKGTPCNSANSTPSTSLTLGAYEFDAESLKPLKLEILRIEMRKVKNLVADFRAKLARDEWSHNSWAGAGLDVGPVPGFEVSADGGYMPLLAVSTLLETKVQKAYELIDKEAGSC